MTTEKLTGEHIRVTGTDVGKYRYGPYDALILNGREYSIGVQTPCDEQIQAAREHARGRKPRLSVQSFGSSPVEISVVEGCRNDRGQHYVARIRLLSAEGGAATTTDCAILDLATRESAIIV